MVARRRLPGHHCCFLAQAPRTLWAGQVRAPVAICRGPVGSAPPSYALPAGPLGRLPRREGGWGGDWTGWGQAEPALRRPHSGPRPSATMREAQAQARPGNGVCTGRGGRAGQPWDELCGLGPGLLPQSKSWTDDCLRPQGVHPQTAALAGRHRFFKQCQYLPGAPGGQAWILGGSLWQDTNVWSLFGRFLQV